MYDVYQSSIELTARVAIQLPVNDPTLLVSAMTGIDGFKRTVRRSATSPSPS